MSYSYNTIYVDHTACKKTDAIISLLQENDKLTKEIESLREEIEYLKSCIANLSDKVSGEDLKNSVIDLSFLL